MDFRKVTSVLELRELLRDRILSGIDTEHSSIMLSLKKKFGAKGIRVNKWWVMTGPDWECPACGRCKAQIVRLDQHQFLMGLLHAHHDHIQDSVRTRFQAEAIKRKAVVANGHAEKFAIRTALGLSAFDKTVICADCNEADWRAKRTVRTHPEFSFSPADIRAFVEPRPNTGPHAINAAKAKAIWHDGQAVFAKRMAMVNRLAKLAASNMHWYQPSATTANQTEKFAKGIFHWSGLYELARNLGEAGGPKSLLHDTVVLQGSVDSWRRKKVDTANSTNKAPSEQDIQLMERTRGKFWARVGPEWTCDCCGRTRYQCVRPSKQTPWVFEVKSKVLYDPIIEEGYSYVEMCEDCSNVAKHLARETLDTVQADLYHPSEIVALAELQDLIKPRPHSPHGIDNAKVDRLLPTLIARIPIPEERS